MNAPQPLAPLDRLIEEALRRLADVSKRAGNSDWVPPAVAVYRDRLQRAAELAGLDHGESLTVALLLAVECDPSIARMVATRHLLPARAYWQAWPRRSSRRSK